MALIVVAAMVPLALNLHMRAAEARIDRASLERMGELAGELLGEARLDDCADWHLTGDTSDNDHVCYLPLSIHAGAAVQTPAPDCDDPIVGGDPADGSGVTFTLDYRTIKVLDCHRLEHNIKWPVRTVQITDWTGRLTLTRSAVGMPS